MSELYDPKFVRFEWDDELLHEDVFAADNIDRLRSAVNSVEFRGDHYSTGCEHGAVTKGDESRPFHVGGTDWRFIYADPYHRFKRAYAKGRTVMAEVSEDKKEWSSVSDLIAKGGFDWEDYTSYRIEPASLPIDSDIFDERFVRKVWNDSLAGCRCFVADEMETLMELVRDGRNVSRVYRNSREDREEFPFRRLEGDGAFRLCYFDPLYGYKAALKKGVTVQTLLPGAGRWTEVKSWDERCEYRVIGERPFCNKAEFMEAVGNGIPWVEKKDGGDILLVTAIRNDSVLLADGSEESWEGLLRGYKFPDGKPCGLSEEVLPMYS